MLQKYEAGFILNPEIAEDRIESELGDIEKEIISAGGSIVNKEFWGKRNFSYPIKKKKEGYYCFFYYQTSPSSQKKVEEAFRGKQNILRSLFIVKKNLTEKEGSKEKQNAGTESQ